MPPADSQVVAGLGQIGAGQGVYAQRVPIKLGRRAVLMASGGFGGAVQPEPPHEARVIVPGAPIVAPVVASMEDVVRAQNDGAGAKRSHFKLLD